MENTTRFVWFWNFWHSSQEAARGGASAGDSWLEIKDNWERWFYHEAGEEDLIAIAEVSHTRAGQSEFLKWLVRHWSEGSQAFENRLVPRYILGQLASARPFSEWKALVRYRLGYGAKGISTLVQKGDGDGETSELCSIETLILPIEKIAPEDQVSREGFKGDAVDLRASIQSASNLFAGRAGWVLFALWVIIGKRPYPIWFRRLMTGGWLFAGGLICWLLLGPDPGEQLPIYCGVLLGLSIALGAIALTTMMVQGLHLWREGRAWNRQLRKSQVRLRMHDAVMIQGGTAGLAFALNLILATYRSAPQIAARSWIWRRIFRTLDRESYSWAATGTITPKGWIQGRPLPLKPGARFGTDSPEKRLKPDQKKKTPAMNFALTSLGKTAGLIRLSAGVQADQSALRVYKCAHLAQALLSMGKLVSHRQAGLNGLALIVSLAVLAALPSIRSSLFQAPPPLVIPPASSSPYYLWVSLDTDAPEQFQVVLESRFWINRRVKVLEYAEPVHSRRAEIRLLRLAHALTVDPEDGVVWIERRRTFLTREYAPGERVGLYTFFYLNHLGRE